MNLQHNHPERSMMYPDYQRARLLRMPCVQTSSRCRGALRTARCERCRRHSTSRPTPCLDGIGPNLRNLCKHIKLSTYPNFSCSFRILEDSCKLGRIHSNLFEFQFFEFEILNSNSNLSVRNLKFDP